MLHLFFDSPLRRKEMAGRIESSKVFQLEARGLPHSANDVVCSPTLKATVVKGKLNYPGSKEMLCPNEEDMLERVIRVRLDRLVQAQVLDLEAPGVNYDRLVYGLKERCYQSKGCCHGLALAFLFHVLNTGVDASAETLFKKFRENLDTIPILSYQNWSKLTLANIVDFVSKQVFVGLGWWRKNCYVVDDSIVMRKSGLPCPPFSMKKYCVDWLGPLYEMLQMSDPVSKGKKHLQIHWSKKVHSVRQQLHSFTIEELAMRLRDICIENEGKHIILTLHYFSHTKSYVNSHDIYIYSSEKKQCFLFFDSNLGVGKFGSSDVFLLFFSLLFISRLSKKNRYFSLTSSLQVVD